MSMDQYHVRRDHFELDDSGMSLCFPCSVCQHRHGSDKDEPCIRCDWNMGALSDDEIARLRAEVKSLRADAARYQFIRSGNADIEAIEPGNLNVCLFNGDVGVGKYYKDMRDLDMVIDEAILTLGDER